MENINTVNKNDSLENENLDFISHNIHEENILLQRELQKRKITMISLGSFYLLLTIISIIVLV